MLKAYVGAKIIKAEPINELNFLLNYKGGASKDLRPKERAAKKKREGYLVIYPDGYTSWSPKETFEQAYRQITIEEVAIINLL